MVSVPPLVGASGQRNQVLDAARFIAAAGVVWVHTVESTQFLHIGALGTFGVPFYVCVALYMMRRALARDAAVSLPKYYLHRFVRLYVPFIVWTIVYLLAIELKRFSVPAVQMLGWRDIAPGVLLSGVTYQLWFLPFLVIITIPAALLYRVTLVRPRCGVYVALVSAAIGTMLGFWPRPVWLDYSAPMDGFYLNAWKALPSAFCGFAMVHFVSGMPRDRNTLSGIAAIGFFLTWATIGNQIVNGYNRLDRTLSGVGWFLMCFAPLHGRAFQLVGRFGRHSYGIFLAHPLFVEGLQTAANIYGIRVSAMRDIAVFIVALAGSTLLSLLASRHPWTALLMGEPAPQAHLERRPAAPVAVMAVEAC